MKTNGREMTLKSDDSLLIPAGETYEIVRDTDASFLLSVGMPTPEHK